MDITNVLFVLALAVLAGLGVAVARRESRKITAVFARLSAELGGEVKKPFGAYPILTFRLDDLDAIDGSSAVRDGQSQ